MYMRAIRRSGGGGGGGGGGEGIRPIESKIICFHLKLSI
jgi:hypothetical protein